MGIFNIEINVPKKKKIASGYLKEFRITIISKTQKKLKKIIFTGKLIFRTCLILDTSNKILNKKYIPYNGNDIEAKPINKTSCRAT